MTDPCIPTPAEIEALLAEREEIEFLDAEVGRSEDRDERMAVIDDALAAAKVKPWEDPI